MVSEETAFLAQIEAASRLREDYLELVRLSKSRALSKMKKNEISSTWVQRIPVPGVSGITLKSRNFKTKPITILAKNFLPIFMYRTVLWSASASEG